MGRSSGVPGRTLVLGLGAAGEAMASALATRGSAVSAVDDQPDRVAEVAAALGVELAPTPADAAAIAALLASVDAVAPSPGVAPHHPVLAAALAAGTPLVVELDLATEWTDVPVAAITGTNGKTTVTTLVASILSASGRRAVLCGNNELPLVAALDAEPTADVYVVEASSFRLAFCERFRPRVGTWLNLAPDHLDWHPDVEDYVAAKARLWRHQRADDLAVGNADDDVVSTALADAPGRTETFSLRRPDATWRVHDGALWGPHGPIVDVGSLRRRRPHDLANALAAAATAAAVGATPEGVATALAAFDGLPHRLAFVGETQGVRYYDDSKATTPHAVLAAIEGFERAVLIAGGRNKGVDLTSLAAATPRLRAVVAIGDAAPEVAAAFDRSGLPVRQATSMQDAVDAAADLAEPGDAVVLSPGCASYDWYRSYAERGDDFARCVADRVGAA